MWLLGAPSPPPLPLPLDKGIRRRSPELAPPLRCLPLEEEAAAGAGAGAGEDSSLAVAVLGLPRAAAFSNRARRSAVGLSLTETPRVL